MSRCALCDQQVDHLNATRCPECETPTHDDCIRPIGGDCVRPACGRAGRARVAMARLVALVRCAVRVQRGGDPIALLKLRWTTLQEDDALRGRADVDDRPALARDVAAHAADLKKAVLAYGGRSVAEPSALAGMLSLFRPGAHLDAKLRSRLSAAATRAGDLLNVWRGDLGIEAPRQKN